MPFYGYKLFDTTGSDSQWPMEVKYVRLKRKLNSHRRLGNEKARLTKVYCLFSVVKFAT